MSFWCVALILVAGCAAQEIFPCGDTAVTVSGSSGVITDHVGPWGEDKYLPQKDCIWNIDVEGDYVSIVVDEIATEYGYDFLMIYDSHDTSGDPVYTLTGTFKEAYYIVNSAQATVRFVSDENLNDNGFILTYHSSSCVGRCNDHGLCEDSTCECDPTFSGSACEIAEGGCEDGCNFPYGTCSAGKCLCEPGWHGAACDNPYCVADTILTASALEFADHARPRPRFLPDTVCKWTIVPDVPSDSIVLEFSEFQLSTSQVEVYDGNVTDSAHLVARTSGFTVPVPAVAHSGTMSVVFTARATPHRGFVASYSTFTCPSGCSGHGSCFSGTCHCNVGFGGADCAAEECTHDCHNSLSDGNMCVGSICACALGYDGVDCGICVESPGDNSTNTTERCERCDGVSNVSATNKITDGAGEYLPSQSCSWTYTSNGSTVALTFEEFDLAEGSSLTITELSTGVLIAVLSGSIVPSAQTSQTNGVRVSFSAGAIIGEGFVGTFHDLHCPNDCSGHGDCFADDTCHCDAGYGTADCSSTQCENGCGSAEERGVCSGDRCQCSTGRFGVDCMSDFCFGRKEIVASSGVIKDHSSFGPYLPHSMCEWRIDAPTAGEKLILVFTKLQTEALFDYVEIATHEHMDGAAHSDGTFLGTTYGSLPPAPFILDGPSVSVRFSSDYYGQLTGFTMEWYSDQQCPGACSGNGLCISEACVCNSGYTGLECADVVVPTELVVGEWLPASVAHYEWAHFYTDFSGPLDLVVTLRRDELFSTVLMYKRGTIPTVEDNDGGAIPMNYPDGTPSPYEFTRLEAPVTPGRIYFAVYGFIGGGVGDIMLNDTSCIPIACGSYCGNVDDTCGGFVDCGTCSTGTCGDGGANRCSGGGATSSSTTSTTSTSGTSSSSSSSTTSTSSSSTDPGTLENACAPECQGTCIDGSCICGPAQKGQNCEECNPAGAECQKGVGAATIAAILLAIGLFCVVLVGGGMFFMQQKKHRNDLAAEMTSVAHGQQFADEFASPPPYPDDSMRTAPGGSTVVADLTLDSVASTSSNKTKKKKGDKYARMDV